MKKIIYSITFALISFANFAQNAIPNGDFESWNVTTYDFPQYYIQNSNGEAFTKCGCPPNEIKSTDFYHGSFAVQVTTQIANGDTNVGYFINANVNGSPSQWTGGVPYTQTPTGIRGYYKSAVPAGDSALIMVNFKKSGNSIGFYYLKLYGTHNSYTLFSLNFNPALSVSPDTVQFGAVSSDFIDNKAIAGSMLKIDSVSFTGVSSQPTQFNGDFENWQSQTMSQPINWYLSGGADGFTGVSQTTDKYAGSYAAELITLLGDRNNQPAASSASISTGYYLNNCGGPNCQRGGQPFTNQIDTLTFYYKYAPSGSDTALANLNFKKNGNFVGGAGTFLLAAATYQYAWIPFNVGTPIDSVIVSFQSSSWRDTAVSYVGSDLKIDEAHFKSQSITTGIKTFDAAIGIKIFPNPSNDGNFVVSNVNTFDLVRVYNVYGQEVNATIAKENDYAKVHINTPGAYFVTVNAHGKITTQKVIVSQN